ncbi:MAG: VanZ family protein [Clostridia bacterium]|nr:VanZ family protein [Clostridia bacterium]
MKIKPRLRVILPLILILLTLVFIWSNSAKDASESRSQSESVASWFKELFDVERQPFRFLYENHRKVAHFLEFALLGSEVSLLLLWNVKRRAGCCMLGIAFCALCATVDECIQLFVPGRACAFSDVCIDTAGSACALIFLFLLVFLWHLFRDRMSMFRKKAA